MAIHDYLRCPNSVTHMACTVFDKNRKEDCICTAAGGAFYLRIKLDQARYGIVFCIIVYIRCLHIFQATVTAPIEVVVNIINRVSDEA